MSLTGRRGMPDEDRDYLISIWKQGIETQMHFAHLSIKMRQIGLTLAGATLALAIVIYRSDSQFSFPLPLGTHPDNLPISSVLCVSAAFILFAAWILDAHMYHRMLRGAVKFNELLEPIMDQKIGWKAGLTETISAYSRFSDGSRALLENREDEKIWTGHINRLAGNKISWFYWLCIISLVGAAVGFLFAGNPQWLGES